MTPKVLAGMAMQYGLRHRDTLSDDICFALAYAKIALWLNAQDEVHDRTVHKMREAMDLLTHAWNRPYPQTQEATDANS